MPLRSTAAPFSLNTRWSDADDCDGPILLRFVATLIGLASPSYLGARGWFSSRYKPVGDAKASLATTGPRDVPDVVPRPLRRQHVSPARRRYRSGTRALAWREPGSSSQASWRSTIDVSSAGRPPVRFRPSLPLWSGVPEAMSCGLYGATYRTRQEEALCESELTGPRTDWSATVAAGAGARRRFLLPIILSVGFFVVGFLALALLPTEAASFDKCIVEETGKLAQEGSGWRFEGSLWPPGIRCIYSPPNGPDVSIVKPVTVGQVTFMAGLCGATGAIAAHLVRHALRSGQDGSRSL